METARDITAGVSFTRKDACQEAAAAE